MKAVVRRHVCHPKNCVISISSMADGSENLGLTGSDKGQWEEKDCHLERDVSQIMRLEGGFFFDTYKCQKLYVVSLLNGDGGLHNRPSTFENGCTAEELLYCQLEFLRGYLIESRRKEN